MSAFTIQVDTSEVASSLAKLSSVVQSGLVREAAQAGAQVMVDEVRARVATIGRRTGNLQGSIYQAYSKDNSGPYRATYHVSWNARKAPHGHLVEFGHLQRYRVYIDRRGVWHTVKKEPLASPRRVAARPFIRPAFESKKRAASDAMTQTMIAGIVQRLGQ